LDHKQIAKGYRLYRGEGMPDGGGEIYSLELPREQGGRVIDEIAWRKPLIIVRYGDKWEVFDTRTRKQVSISDSDRKTDPQFRDIPSFAPKKAWEHLWRYHHQW